MGRNIPPIVSLAGALTGRGDEVHVAGHESTRNMTGTVEDAAAPFAEWIGRSEYQEGEVGLVSIAGLENVFGYAGSIRFN